MLLHRLPSGLRIALAAIAAVLSISLVGLLAACGNDNYRNVATASDQQLADQGEVQCLDDDLSPDDVNKLKSIAASDPQLEVAAQNSGDQVCLIHHNADGTIQQQYVTRNDHNPNWMLFAMLQNNARAHNDMLRMGMISGQLDPLTAMMLMKNESVRDDGGIYHPYTPTSDGRYARADRVVNTTYHVTNVQYGSSKPVAYQQARTQAPPQGYTKPASYKPEPDKAVTVSKDSRNSAPVETTSARPKGSTGITANKDVNAPRTFSNNSGNAAKVTTTKKADPPQVKSTTVIRKPAASRRSK